MGDTDVSCLLLIFPRDVECHQKKRKEKWTVKWSCQEDGTC